MQMRKRKKMRWLKLSREKRKNRLEERKKTEKEKD